MARRHRLSAREWWALRRGRLLQIWSFGIVVSVVVTVASEFGYLDAIQARTFDLLMHLRGQRSAPQIVIVAIDEAAFNALGQRQPLPRAYLAKLVRGLQRGGAAAVALDIEFAVATAPEEDGALARAIMRFGDDGLSRVVLVGPVLPRTGPLADPALRRAVLLGRAETREDDDGIVRRTPLVLRREGRVQPALGLAVTARLAGLDQGALERALTEGGLRLPSWSAARGWNVADGPALAIAPDRPWPINFLGGAGSVLTIPSSAVAALDDPGVDVPRDNPLRDRIVFVGGTFTESRDFFQTPHGLMPGVELHANVVHMLTTGSFIRPSGWALSLGLQIIVVLVAGTLTVLVRPLVATIACVAGAFVVGLPASYLTLTRFGYWIDFVLPVLATRWLGAVADKLERRRFRRSFGRYVSREVADQILADAPGLRGERREVSILFSDVRGFTTLSESMPPAQVARQLNDLFDEMTRAIFRHRGMVNDFIGDAIMAIFGAPLPDEEHALHAAQAALAMVLALERLNERWEAAGLPALHVGIGVHSGEVFAGNVGGVARVKYTIVGDAVNVASRVEGINKELGTTVLITEATRAMLGARADVKDCGAVQVKGRVQTVRVHELVAVHPDVPVIPSEVPT